MGLRSSQHLSRKNALKISPSPKNTGPRPVSAMAGNTRS